MCVPNPPRCYDSYAYYLSIDLLVSKAIANLQVTFNIYKWLMLRCFSVFLMYNHTLLSKHS